MTPATRTVLERLNTAPDGRLTFAEVMRVALYHPDHGYYGPGPRRIGRKGDFFTSVSVGPLYGRLLADYARETWVGLGSPRTFHLIEQGAHDGQLAEDVLAAAGDFATDYWVVEPNPSYRRAQEERLAGRFPQVRWVTRLADLPAGPGFFLSNELPDAMPVHVVRWNGSAWEERYVAMSEAGALTWLDGPLSSERLAAEVKGLPRDLPPGYTTEIGLAALEWMQELAAAPFTGAILIADYGLDAEEYYQPERNEGTLRRYHHHRTDGQVLDDLGECDLTAHVNFSRLIEAGQSAGMILRAYEHQGRFLGKAGLPWLASLEGHPPNTDTQALLRQYQSLTHPGFMGRSFRVLVMEKPGAPA